MDSNGTHSSTLDEDTIDLKELILTIWQERVLVSIVLVLSILLSAVYSFLIVSPTYEASTALLFKMPKTVTTEYGVYEFPSQNINDYLQFATSNDLIAAIQSQGQYGLSDSTLKSSITVKTTKDSNLVEIVTATQDPQITFDLNQDLARLFGENVRILFKKNALDFFLSSQETKLALLEDQIRQLESVLAAQNQTLANQKPTFAVKSILLPANSALDPAVAGTEAETDKIVEEQYLVDSYYLLQMEITQNQNTLLELQQAYTSQLDKQQQLQHDKSLYDAKIGTPAQNEWLGGQLDVFAGNLLTLSQPAYPQKPVSPNHLLNLAIGAVLGLMLGLFLAIFKKWWTQPTQ